MLNARVCVCVHACGHAHAARSNTQQHATTASTLPLPHHHRLHTTTCTHHRTHTHHHRTTTIAPHAPCHIPHHHHTRDTTHHAPSHALPPPNARPHHTPHTAAPHTPHRHTRRTIAHAAHRGTPRHTAAHHRTTATRTTAKRTATGITVTGTTTTTATRNTTNTATRSTTTTAPHITPPPHHTYFQVFLEIHTLIFLEIAKVAIFKTEFDTCNEFKGDLYNKHQIKMTSLFRNQGSTYTHTQVYTLLRYIYFTLLVFCVNITFQLQNIPAERIIQISTTGLR